MLLNIAHFVPLIGDLVIFHQQFNMLTDFDRKIKNWYKIIWLCLKNYLHRSVIIVHPALIVATKSAQFQGRFMDRAGFPHSNRLSETIFLPIITDRSPSLKFSSRFSASIL